jgi:hypothetical protein
MRAKITLIITHRLPAGTFTEFPNGDGDAAVVSYLREVQHRRHRMLPRAGADAANGSDRVLPAVAALQAGSKLPATEQEADRRNVAWLFSLPHSVGRAGDCLIRLDPGSPPGFSYLACAVARGAVGADARCRGVPCRRSPISTSIDERFHCSPLGRRGYHELGVLHPICLACDDTATQLGIRTGGGRRLSDRPSHPAKRQRLWRRDNPEAYRGFATSWPLDPVIAAQSRCRRLAANRRPQPTCGSVDRPGPRTPSPNADTIAVGTTGPGVVQWT